MKRNNEGFLNKILALRINFFTEITSKTDKRHLALVAFMSAASLKQNFIDSYYDFQLN